MLANIALCHNAVLKHQASQENLEAVSFTLDPLSEISAASHQPTVGGYISIGDNILNSNIESKATEATSVCRGAFLRPPPMATFFGAEGR